MGKEETYKDRLQQEGRDEDLFAPKKREPRASSLHRRGSRGDEESPEQEETALVERAEDEEHGQGERKAA